MTRFPVLLVLLQVFSLHLVAVAMPTCQLEGHIVQSANQLLRDLGGAAFPASCLSFNANVSFPDSALAAHRQCRQALWVVVESLQEAELLFEVHGVPVEVGGASWDEKKFDKFRHLQHRLTETGSCVSTTDGDVSVSDLSSYFGNVTSVLQQPASAACGWLILNRDLGRVLETTMMEHKQCLTWRHTH